MVNRHFLAKITPYTLVPGQPSPGAFSLLRPSIGVLTANTGHVVIVAAEQHGPGWSAHWRGMELRKQNPLAGQSINTGRANRAAVNTQIGVTHVICDNKQDIRLTLLGVSFSIPGCEASLDTQDKSYDVKK